ncbi:LysR family transcriptional regulator [Alsobacter sp. SYSU M60028]|uniref:LysR family transcriptional regulator n=1 Tax=Alsobacter ponti TaxID=2962936 RepID=A0ABT1LGX4_9HYPH|nr:LysR family transcriptional regulator [Alsobacter ponti]MCP8940750.1 LysR family transcriptional regulator [Alsobacter ponti]
MELRELRYFVQVAELKSFSKASVHLRIAQPALSRQVRKLEEELGVELFVRAGRGLHLTHAGMLLRDHAQALLRQVTQAADDVRAHAGEVTGSITIGVPPSAGEVLIPTVVRRSLQLHPGLRINIVSAFSGDLYEKLLNQELDLCLLHNPAPHRNLDIQELLVDHMYLIGPGPGFPAVPPVTKAMAGNIDGLPLIMPSRVHNSRVVLESSVQERGGGLNIKHQVDGLLLIKSMVREGLGYTVLTYGSVYMEVEAGVMTAEPLTPEVTWTLCMAHNHEQRMRGPVQALMEIIRDEIQTLVDQHKWRGTPKYVPRPQAETEPRRKVRVGKR